MKTAKQKLEELVKLRKENRQIEAQIRQLELLIAKLKDNLNSKAN